jgi:hypothetical protein
LKETLQAINQMQADGVIGKFGTAFCFDMASLKDGQEFGQKFLEDING